VKEIGVELAVKEWGRQGWW